MRQRYIAVKIKLERKKTKNSDLNSAVIWRVVWHSLLQLYGEYGASKTDLSLIEYDPENMHAIFRCTHKGLNIVRNAISAVTQVKGLKAAFHVLYVSGTLRSLRRKLMKSSL